MSAATASRNYGGSATQTMTAPSTSSSHHHQIYPTPHSSSSRANGAIASSANPRATYGYPLKTAGESWSIKNEGDKQVIVIEDTPEPAPGTSSNANAATSSSRPSTASNQTAARGTKKARANGYPSEAYQLNNYHYPPPSANPVASSSTVLPLPAYTGGRVSTTTQGKRKHNEVNDPSAAVSFLVFYRLSD